MKFKLHEDTGPLCVEFCAGWMIQMCSLTSNGLPELRVEGRACVSTRDHVRRRADDPASSYIQMAA